jgi:transposase
MSELRIERLDHHGLVAGIIDDLQLVERIDERIESDEQETISVGEAMKAMIINGLGFCNRPLMLTPQFFENLPVELLFRTGVKAADFNRHKLGRALDEVYAYGCDGLFSELALAACAQDGVEVRNNSLDSTSYSLTGAYDRDDEVQAIEITYGHSKDHRPDLKQVVQELLVSQDGGFPLWMSSHDGNANDSVIFRERATALVAEFNQSEAPRYLIADSKLYTQQGAQTLAQLLFITRIPGTLALEKSCVQAALATPQAWQPLTPTYRYQRVDHTHYGIIQRWLVVYSEGAYQRAEATLLKAQHKEQRRLDKAVMHLQAQRFASPEQALTALEALTETARYHYLAGHDLMAHKRYAGHGRPRANSPVKAIEWQLQARFRVDEPRLEALRQTRACFIIATNIPDYELNDHAVFQTYKNQASVEHGFRFLKDPLFFVSSLFLKKPSRIQSLLMVMTLSLLVYTLAQRRLRRQLARTDDTLPNQIDVPTATPTLRWVFQMLEGIHRVVIPHQLGVQTLIHGITALREKILRLFGKAICQKYQISWASG